jgi:hypothetical protein
MAMITNEDIALICKRIGEKVNASSRILTRVAIKLHELGGVFDGNRTDWADQFETHSIATVNRMTNILVGKGVIAVTKSGKEVGSYAMDYRTIDSMLAVTGPDPTRHKTKAVRGKCGHMAVELYDGICYGCHVRAIVNRQRKGKCKV